VFTRNRVIMSHNIKTPLTSISRAVGNILQLKYGQIIKSLFANNEQGFVYDPNDLSTMFQDSAGTIPVTAVGQPVGLMLDKSKGVVLGSELASVTEVVSLPIDGVVGVKTYNIGTVAIGKTYQISFTVTNYTGSGDVGIAGPSTHWADGTAVNTASNGTKTCIRTNIGTGSINLYTRNTAACVFSNISIKELKGNHAYQSVSASRPILQRNATTGAYYLAFDGIDDFLRTNAINFTATNKVSLVAGIRKLSDSTDSVVVETGTNYFTPTGGFALFSSNSFGLFVGFGVSGVNTFYIKLQPGYSAPRSLVTSLRLDLSAIDRPTQVKFNIDGARKDIAEGTAATGTFANTPIFIGRRGGTALPFNGHIYGLIGVGKLTTDSETAAIEKELAKRTGVTLDV